MYIFNSQTELKDKAKKVHSLIKSSLSYNHSSVIQALLTDASRIELQFAKNVSNELAKINVGELSLGQVQQIIAHKSNNVNYQTFRERTFENKLDARSFLGIKFSVGDANWLRFDIVHPFPVEFEQIDVLKPWKKVWEKLNISSKDRPFLAPALPAECFEGENIATKQFQDWSLNERKCTTYGNAGVLVYSNEKIVGSMKWYWWGHGDSFKASDFSFYLLHKNTIIRALIDIVPSNTLPTLGPYIEVDVLSPNEIEAKFNSIMRDLECLRKITD